jgi:hypothetical protein
VPDFGYQEVISFYNDIQRRDSMFGPGIGISGSNGIGTENGRNKGEMSRRSSGGTGDKTSKWALFYDAIKKYPKFEKLKNYIDEANKIKHDEEELKKQ